MKSLELKKSTEKVLLNGIEQEYTFSTIELIKVAVNSLPQGGYTASDMMNRLRILEVLETHKSDPTLTLEDQDYENLISYVKDTKWGILSRFIMDFIKQFS